MKYWQNREWLEREYVINARTTQDIGKETKENSGTVYYWLKKLNIPTRSKYNDKTARMDLLHSYDWMHDSYVLRKLSLKKIAALTGVSCLTVRRKLALHNIQINPVGAVLTDVVYDRPKGAASPTWKGGKSVCVDCGALLAARYKQENPRCAACRRLFYRGERHHSWVSNKTPKSLTNAVRRSAQYKDWRKSVYMRDRHTCVICGVQGGNLHAHHLNSFSEFPDLRFDTGNGVTLCEADHLAFHRQYGMGGNTADQFSEFAATARTALATHH